jgi:hypothetical protein
MLKVTFDIVALNWAVLNNKLITESYVIMKRKTIFNDVKTDLSSWKPALRVEFS